MTTDPATVRIVDLDPDERDEIERQIVDARRLGAYLRIEIRAVGQE